MDRTGEYLPLNEAAKRLGISGFTIRRRIAAGELAVWVDPLDRRRRLIRRRDLDRYAKPRRQEVAPIPA